MGRGGEGLSDDCDVWHVCVKSLHAKHKLMLSIEIPTLALPAAAPLCRLPPPLFAVALSQRTRFTPHALQRVPAPSGPSRHCGVLVAPHCTQAFVGLRVVQGSTLTQSISNEASQQRSTPLMTKAVATDPLPRLQA